jgi:hypothetical protein
MRKSMLLIVLAALAAASIANEPVFGIPWPVGSTIEMMSEVKPLMNGYGDRNNNDFHTGIDIDDCTEPEDGDRVRCVEDGFIGRIFPMGEPGWAIVVVPTLESRTDGVMDIWRIQPFGKPTGKRTIRLVPVHS